MRIDRIKLITEMARAEIKVGELAERAGLCRGTVTGIKSGRTCTRETAGKIAGALGLPMDALLKE